MSGVALLSIFVLAVFVGFEVVSKVSTTLHTPLMSGANAIHGIILVGAILVTADAHTLLAEIVGAVAIVLATANLVGGFVVTDRMLEMFQARPGAGRAGAVRHGMRRTGVGRRDFGRRGGTSSGPSGGEGR